MHAATRTLSQSLCAPLTVLLLASPLQAQDERTVVRPADTGEALVNPGMGWTLHYYSNIPTNYGSRLAPSDTVPEFPGLSTVYLRIPWSYLEPEEGVFNWAVVDGPAQRWIDEGKYVAFRFSCSESWMRYATPKWVQDAGAKGYDFRPGDGVVEGGPFWEPDYNDPVFLEKLDSFLAAAAARYDGKPEVAFIDVGSFGVWGEGHLWASTRMEYSAETVNRHIDLHLKHFEHTLLAANDDFAFQGDETIQYALEKGLTLRDDSILVQPGENAYFHSDMAQDFWPMKPVVLECEHYGGSRDRGNWQDGSLYLRAVEDYHASFASIHWWPREFLEPNRELIRKINMRLGYRLQLVEASWPTEVLQGDKIDISATWRNTGVAPCLRGGFPAFTLKDADGGIVTVLVDESFDARNLQVGPPGEAETMAHRRAFEMPFYVAPGEYDLFVSMGTRSGKPTIALPLPDGDGHRRYRIETIKVGGHYTVEAGELGRRGDEWVLPLTFTINRELPEGVVPFCHLERGGPIEVQGLPAGGAGLDALGGPGVVEVECVFPLPADAAVRTYDVLVGLWLPNRIAQPDERLIPEGGQGDRRVLVGRLRVDAAGNPALLGAE